MLEVPLNANLLSRVTADFEEMGQDETLKSPVQSPVEIAVAGLRGLPDVIGGIESHSVALYPRMSALMPDAKIRIYARAQFVQQKPHDYKGLIVHPLPAPNIRRVEAFVHTFYAVCHARFIARAKVIHIHGIGPNFWAPFARLLGLKVISTHHGQDYKRKGMSLISKTILWTGEWAAVHFAHRLIVVSKPVTQSLKQLYPKYASKIDWLPNGFTSGGSDDAEEHVRCDEPALLASLGVEAKRYVLAVGRIDPAKDLDTLVLAFQKSGIKEKLLIVGSPHHEERYAEHLRSISGPNVIFAGFRRPYELMPLYRNASLFVLPSLHEGFSVSILEAIQNGTPLLVSDIEANKVLSLAPINYFPVGDVEALGEALKKPHELFRFDDEAFSRRYDWDNIANQTSQIYRAMIEHLRK